MLKAILALIIVVSLTACVHQDYLGETYAPTSNVHVIYDESETPADGYHVMGTDRAEAPSSKSAESIVQEIIKKAQSVGADAVVITGIEEVESGSTSNTVYTDPVGGRSDYIKGTSTTTSTVQVHKVITAKFLKKKENVD